MNLTQEQLNAYGGTLIRLSVKERGCGEITSLLDPVVGDRTEVSGDQLVLSKDFFAKDAYSRADEVWAAITADNRSDWARARRLSEVAKHALVAPTESVCAPSNIRVMSHEDLRARYLSEGVDITTVGGTAANLYRYLALGSSRGEHSIAAWNELDAAGDVKCLAFLKAYLSWSMRPAASSEEREIVNTQRSRFTQLVKSVERYTDHANN